MAKSLLALRFGAGLNSRASEDEIDPRECADGQNFILDLDNREYRPRDGIDLIGAVPNGARINGFAQLVKADGTISTLVQAGSAVYEWTGGSNFVSRGTVSASARLRGRLEHNWPLDDEVLITDIAGVQPLMKWDGTTLSTVATNLSGDFIPKYCLVSGERAWFANVSSNAVLTPHVICASEVEDYTNLSTSNKPASGLGEADPFYLVSPDLKPVNGLAEAFGVRCVSTQKGNIFKITGASAKDMSIVSLHPDSGVSGAESMVFVGNDIHYGRQGRIESLARTDQFGDVETDDISRAISNLIQDYDEWSAVFNKRLQRVYFFPVGVSEVWVLQKSLLDEQNRSATARQIAGKNQTSPWVRWVTSHPMAFQPTAQMNFYDPDDGLEYVFMGDASGNIYRLEGTSAGDAGSVNILTSRTSASFAAPKGAINSVSGYIKYRKNEAFAPTISLLWSGSSPTTQAIDMTIQAVQNRPVYAGGLYYNDDNYYTAALSGRFVREPLTIVGQSEEFQVKIDVDGTSDFRIAEIGLEFDVA